MHKLLNIWVSKHLSKYTEYFSCLVVLLLFAFHWVQQNVFGPDLQQLNIKASLCQHCDLLTL